MEIFQEPTKRRAFLIVPCHLGIGYLVLDIWILLPAQYTVKTLGPKSITITEWQSPFQCQMGSFLYRGRKLRCLLHLNLHHNFCFNILSMILGFCHYCHCVCHTSSKAPNQRAPLGNGCMWMLGLI